ncbi:glycosyltransferase family 2 protein [Methanobrevibacter sp.]|uniref:glycosyltransferase family 2 protein n=1 Tax=Methanobrevibacter sp. TaxID=66852 RepID=UPI0025DD4948|nr:glycosyltransferase family 2 protein [Methanobrevibacter sp.]MEE0024624.1 glycosyltransferase family 2 protein [Methanobrevibacter sp.]
MSQYKISVIVSTYNTGNYLNEFLNSIKSQSIGFENIEVIFVDDKSTDNYTLDLLKDFNESYENVKVKFSDVNSGFPGKGRNTGLKLADSDYVIFADHDDTYTKNAFEVMYDKIAENDMLISNFNQVYPNKTIPFKSIYKDSGEIRVLNIDDDKNLLRVPAAIWTRLFRKDFLINNGIYFLEGMLAEDVYVATYSCLKANGIIYLNDFYSYNYKIRDSKNDKSTIHVRNRKYIEAILNGYYKIDEMLMDLEKTTYGETIFKSHLTSWLYTIVLSKLEDNDKKELFIKSHDIFEKYYSSDPFFKKRYDKLVDLILNNKFDEAVIESNRLEKIQKNMNNRSLLSKIKNKLVR